MVVVQGLGLGALSGVARLHGFSQPAGPEKDDGQEIMARSSSGLAQAVDRQPMLYSSVDRHVDDGSPRLPQLIGQLINLDQQRRRNGQADLLLLPFHDPLRWGLGVRRTRYESIGCFDTFRSWFCYSHRCYFNR